MQKEWGCWTRSIGAASFPNPSNLPVLSQSWRCCSFCCDRVVGLDELILLCSVQSLLHPMPCRLHMAKRSNLCLVPTLLATLLDQSASAWNPRVHLQILSCMSKHYMSLSTLNWSKAQGSEHEWWWRNQVSLERKNWKIPLLMPSLWVFFCIQPKFTAQSQKKSLPPLYSLNQSLSLSGSQNNEFRIWWSLSLFFSWSLVY